MALSKTQALLKLAERQRFIRPKDLDSIGVPHNYLQRLVNRGKLHKLQRGMYATADQELLSENSTLIEVSHKIPKAIICLLSALRFHEIGTQIPNEVWMALDVHAWAPKISYPLVRIVRFSGATSGAISLTAQEE